MYLYKYYINITNIEQIGLFFKSLFTLNFIRAVKWKGNIYFSKSISLPIVNHNNFTVNMYNTQSEFGFNCMDRNCMHFLIYTEFMHDYEGFKCLNCGRFKLNFILCVDAYLKD